MAHIGTTEKDLKYSWLCLVPFKNSSLVSSRQCIDAVLIKKIMLHDVP